MLLASSVVFTAVSLWHEVAIPLPSTNDDANHFLWIQRAADALARGESVFDPWSPDMELGYPPFAHYQSLPHLFVVFAHRLLLGVVDLFTVFNLTRLVLLASLPLTVFWSLRRMGLAPVAAAFAGAASPLLSASYQFGFEHESYLWRGYGLYTQLWAMHLSFAALAATHRVLERGTGHVPATLLLAALALSHLIYAYMLAIALLVVLLAAPPREYPRRLVQSAAVALPALLLSAHSLVPFVLERAYLHVSVYTAAERFDSHGALQVLRWLVTGALFDNGRLPVLTVLLGAGLLVAVVTNARTHRLFAVLFVTWVILYFGRPTLGALVDLLPFHEGLLLHRFVGGVHMFGLVLIGIGAEALLSVVPRAIAGIRARLAIAPRAPQASAIVQALLAFALLTPAVAERSAFYDGNQSFMARTRAALDQDTAAQQIISALHALPPGRVFAGLRSTWGDQALQLGLPFRTVRFVDLLTFEQLQPIVMYTGWSLNSELLFDFNDRDAAHYRIFGVRYVVAPAGLAVADFLMPILRTSRYNLYAAPGDGYAAFVTLEEVVGSRTHAEVFEANRLWLRSASARAGRHLLHDYPARDRSRRPLAGQECSGVLSEERFAPGRIEVTAECAGRGVIVFKTTYHPNWRVSVDGAPSKTLMVSPSYLSVEVPPGRHRVVAEYHSPPLRAVLLLVAGASLVVLLVFEGRLRKIPVIGRGSG